jgi:prefoldin beta subunit
MITQQRQQVELRLQEIEEALEELKKTTEKTPIYKSVGAVLIKTKGKTEVQKELRSNKESLELRKTTLEKQEGRTREKLNELQSKVQNALNLQTQPQAG